MTIIIGIDPHKSPHTAVAIVGAGRPGGPPAEGGCGLGRAPVVAVQPIGVGCLTNGSGDR